MANTGWIRLHRKIVENELLWDPEIEPFSRGQAWMDLVMAVNHKDKDILIGKSLVRVNRGQKITSIRKLCAKWGWGRHKVEDYLKLLVEHGMLIVEGTPHGTLVTVVNYELYQSGEDDEGTQTDEPMGHEETNLGDTNRLAQGTQTDDKQECIKNDKNVKNEKNDKELLNNHNARETGSNLPNPFEQVKNEQLKDPSKRKTLRDELEYQLSMSQASDEIKDICRKWYDYRIAIKHPIKTDMYVRNLVANATEGEVKYGPWLILRAFKRSMDNEYQGVWLADDELKRLVRDLQKRGEPIGEIKGVGVVGNIGNKGGQQAIDWSSL